MPEVIDTPLLRGTRWALWAGEAIAADASQRRYTRLTGPDGETAILLESDPAQDDSLDRFLSLATLLTDHGLAAPRILLADVPKGTALLSDLGQTDLAHAGTDFQLASLITAEVLAHLHGLDPTPGLSSLDPRTGGEMVGVTAHHYGRLDDAEPLIAATEAAMRDHLPKPTVLALRDVHAENLIWRPQAQGLERIGLLDFQDALIAPAGYDLASFLRDVRRDVDPAVGDGMIRHYCALTGQDTTQMRLRLAVLGAQRNLRILGVFARLIRTEGKPRYRAFLPRTWRLLMEDLAHPDLTQWREIVTSSLRPPSQTDLIADIR